MATHGSSIEKLSERYPNTAQWCAMVGRISTAVGSISTEPFFEPVSLIDLSGKNRVLNAVGPEELTSWSRHVAYGTRVRVCFLESSILDCLGAERVLVPMILLRSHLETAGLAAFCLEALTDSAREKTFVRLREIIPKVLFGTSLFRLARRDEWAEEQLLFSESDVLPITTLVEALDQYSAGGGPVGLLFRRTYAMLCEFAHPNLKGIRHVMSSKDVPGGWEIQYDGVENDMASHAEMALEILAQSMRAGHAASELLRLAEFPGTHSDFFYQPASPIDFERIWKEIIGNPTS